MSTLARRHAGLQAQRGRGAGRLAHDHHGRDLTADASAPPAWRRSTGRPPARPSTPFGHAGCDRACSNRGRARHVGERATLHDVGLVTTYSPRAGASAARRLRRRVQDVGALESRIVRPHQLDHLHEPPPALDLDVGLLDGIEAVVARNVRAVAPDDPRARRQQPPHVPGAAQQLLDLGDRAPGTPAPDHAARTPARRRCPRRPAGGRAS